MGIIYSPNGRSWWWRPRCGEVGVGALCPPWPCLLSVAMARSLPGRHSRRGALGTGRAGVPRWAQRAWEGLSCWRWALEEGQGGHRPRAVQQVWPSGCGRGPLCVLAGTGAHGVPYSCSFCHTVSQLPSPGLRRAHSPGLASGTPRYSLYPAFGLGVPGSTWLVQTGSELENAPLSTV